jgi:hypothetical protein
LLRKTHVIRIKRKFKKQARLYRRGLLGLDDIRPGIASWLGHAGHADTYALRSRVLGSLIFAHNRTNYCCIEKE